MGRHHNQQMGFGPLKLTETTSSPPTKMVGSRPRPSPPSPSSSSSIHPLRPRWSSCRGQKGINNQGSNHQIESQSQKRGWWARARPRLRVSPRRRRTPEASSSSSAPRASSSSSIRRQPWSPTPCGTCSRRQVPLGALAFHSSSIQFRRHHVMATYLWSTSDSPPPPLMPSSRGLLRDAPGRGPLPGDLYPHPREDLPVLLLVAPLLQVTNCCLVAFASTQIHLGVLDCLLVRVTGSHHLSTVMIY